MYQKAILTLYKPRHSKENFESTGDDLIDCSKVNYQGRNSVSKKWGFWEEVWETSVLPARSRGRALVGSLGPEAETL